MNQNNDDKKNEPLRANDPRAYEGWDENDDPTEYRRRQRKPRKSEW